MKKIAMVTGGSRGLGYAICEKLIEEGFETFEFSRSGNKSYSINCDFNDYKNAASVFDDFLHQKSRNVYDEILFINNAGVLGPISSIGRMEPSEISNNINVNLTAPFTFISKFVDVFRDHDSKKTVVNISSGAALHAYAGWSLYCASKAGLEQFIRSLAVQEKSEKFPFCAVNYNPSVMDTNMQKEIRNSDKSDFPEKEKFLELHGKGQLRSPDYVASHLTELVKTELVSGKTYSILDL